MASRKQEDEQEDGIFSWDPQEVRSWTERQCLALLGYSFLPRASQTPSLLCWTNALALFHPQREEGREGFSTGVRPEVSGSYLASMAKRD